MKKFESFEQYCTITRQAQEREGVRNINVFLLPDEIKSLIADGRLHYMENLHTLQIVELHDRFCKVCWYADDKFEFIDFQSSVPIVADLPFSFKRDKILAFERKLLESGFVSNSSTTRMQSQDFGFDLVKDTNFSITAMEKQEVDDVLEIWEENFDAVQNLLYSKQELENSQNQFFVLKDENKSVVGAMEVVINPPYGWVQRISIKKQFQGRGLGSLLERYYINFCKSLGVKKLMLYTIDGNANANHFHKKFNFKPDGRYNCQYVYRNQK